MDAITLVAYTFEIGSALVERCELVKQCHTESTRIAVRTLSVLASLESASNEFSGRVEFEASLTELKRALEEARDLVSRCQKARSVVAKIGALMRANTLKKELVRVEGDLERVAADLQIPMLADIRKAVRYINERESEAAAAPSGVDAEMLEQAVRDAIRKELYNTSQGRAVDETIKDNLSKLYEAEAAVAEDQQWYSSPPDAAGGRPLLCPGHGEECALRTTKKEGPNLGRQFYCCPRTSKEQCRMFAWVDECDGDGDGEKGTRSGRGGVASGGRGGDGRVCKKHKEPCAFFEVKREGPNKGRHFYNCARTGTQRCSSFTWADKKPVAASTGGGERGREIVGRSAAAPVPRRGGKGGGGERKPLCKGHQEPCSLQITKKEKGSLPDRPKTA